MNLNVTLAAAAAVCAFSLGLIAVIRQPRSIVSWLFLPAMLILALESAIFALLMREWAPAELSNRENLWRLALTVQSLIPGFWLAFSIVYGRGNYREFLSKWKVIVGIVLIVPLILGAGSLSQLVLTIATDARGQILVSLANVHKLMISIVLVGNILVLANLEKTLRSAVGTIRWRVKFVILGLVLLFGARVYTQSEALLFSGYDLTMPIVHSIALLIACALIAFGYARDGLAQLDIYPSQALLKGSVTILLTGGYLFIVGTLAQVATALGGVENFRTQALIVLLGVAGLTILLFSSRARLHIQNFVSRHLRRSEHDFRLKWTQFTERTYGVLDPVELCGVTSRFVSETFNAMSVSAFLIDTQNGWLTAAGSTTSKVSIGRHLLDDGSDLSTLTSAMSQRDKPFDLDHIQTENSPESAWAQHLKEATPSQFEHGGNRMCVPLIAGGRLLGLMVLGDRVHAVPYSHEELDLLKCLGDQVAAALLNRQLSQELVGAKEMEAFQTMSTFFVHDMKNLASRLNLMLQNLPNHFDDPEFRGDALRSISSTVDRINQLVKRLGELRKTISVDLVETDLNKLVSDAVDELNFETDLQISKQLEPLPKVAIDREQIRSVLTNLLVNAREAVLTADAERDAPEGFVKIKASRGHDNVTFLVADNGTGMSPEFVQDSLFRPFQSTKQKGLGIGMFQSKASVETHRGTMQVKSIPGKGTTIRVTLPVAPSEELPRKKQNI